MAAETPVAARRVRPWVLAPALCAPVALIGGWTMAADVQRPGYSSLSGSISDLAADYARLPVVMTVGLVVTGVCLVLQAIALGSIAAAGRWAMAIGGVGVLSVAAEPLPGGGQLHTAAALSAFLALAVWPALGAARDAGGPAGRGPATAATTVGLLLLFALYATPQGAGWFGLVERLLAGAEVGWVSVVSLAARRVDGVT